MSALFESGGYCDRRKVRPAVILVLVVLLCRTDAMSTSFRSQDTTVEAQGLERDDSQLELEIGRNILANKKALPLNSLEMGDLASANGTVGAHYRSNWELEAALQNFTQRCSHISRLYTIGNSTLGVPLWVVEISDKPGVSEPEPAFKYVGNMHGDEPLGRELVLLLADWLCDNYLKDSLATLIVDKLHLHLLPSMNPDGFAAQPNPTRNNAHDVDLNRDFPDQFFSQNNIEEKRQAETRAVMNWVRSTRFTASASFHEGALVANYPYDGTHDLSTKYAVSPDDSTFKYLAGVYADNHPLMLKSKEFAGGVTNGAAWYPLYGGMQDWNYLHGNCLELTLEMNEDKWPPPMMIPQIWSEHRKSMLELVAVTVTSGVHGRVMSSRKGQPLAATISISGISHSMTASAEFGDYHRLLASGQVYEVTASMAGYSSRSTSIFLPNRTGLMLDFILDPLPTNVGGARLRGHGLFDKENILPPAPQKRAAGKVPPAKEQNSLRKFPGIGLHSDDEESGFAFTSPISKQQHLMYLFPLLSVATIAVFLFLASSRGSSRHRSRVSIV